MKRALPRLGLAGAALAAVASVAFLVIALGARSDADGSLARAERLYAARLAVAEAQQGLGTSDLDEAVRSAREANATALRVGGVTARIVASLERTDEAAGAIARSSRRGARGAIFTQRQTAIVADILGAIAGYQDSASSDTRATNSALERILRSLRATNRSFPGGDE